MKKFILGLFACVTAAVVLAGCSKPADSEPTPPAAPDTNAPAEAPAP